MLYPWVEMVIYIIITGKDKVRDRRKTYPAFLATAVIATDETSKIK